MYISTMNKPGDVIIAWKGSSNYTYISYGEFNVKLLQHSTYAGAHCLLTDCDGLTMFFIIFCLAAVSRSLLLNEVRKQNLSQSLLLRVSVLLSIYL